MSVFDFCCNTQRYRMMIFVWAQPPSSGRRSLSLSLTRHPITLTKTRSVPSRSWSYELKISRRAWRSTSRRWRGSERRLMDFVARTFFVISVPWKPSPAIWTMPELRYVCDNDNFRGFLAVECYEFICRWMRKQILCINVCAYPVCRLYGIAGHNFCFYDALNSESFYFFNILFS